MDDILLEAAAEVEKKHAQVKKSTGDILMAAAEEAEDEYEEDAAFEEEEMSRTDLSRDDVKNILKKAARNVDADDAADGRDALKKVVESLGPDEGGDVAKKQSHPSDRDIGQMLNDAAEELFDGMREFDENNDKELSDDESSVDYEGDSIAEDDHNEDAKQYSDNNLFMISVYRRDMDAIDKHLRKGANLLHTDRHGWTPLHWAAAKGFDDVLDLLISEYRGNTKKYVNCKDHITGWTPLHLACVGGHIDSITILLDNGAKKKVKNCMDETPWDCVGVSIRTSEGRRIAKVMGKWKENEGIEKRRKEKEL